MSCGLAFPDEAVAVVLDLARDGSAAAGPRDRDAEALRDEPPVGRPSLDERAKIEGASTAAALRGLVRALPRELLRLAAQRRVRSVAEPLDPVRDAAEAVSTQAWAAAVRRESGRDEAPLVRVSPGLRRFAREGGWERFPRWTKVDATAPACYVVLPSW